MHFLYQIAKVETLQAQLEMLQLGTKSNYIFSNTLCVWE